MDWPLDTPAVPESELPLFNQYYLHTYRAACDPTMVWGTEVDTRRLKAYLQRVNRRSRVLISSAHVLVRAVGEALVRHPQFNRRVLDGRIYEFRQVNVLMPLLIPMQQGCSHPVDVCLLRDAATRSPVNLAEELWQYQREAARGEAVYRQQERLFRRLPRFLARRLLRLLVWTTNHLNRSVNSYNEQLRTAPALVNYLNFQGAPPMRSFKPSRFPSDSLTLSVTMGPGERRPTVVGEQVAVRPVAPLFVRADHRIVHAHDLAQFVNTLRTLLSDLTWIEEAHASNMPEETDHVVALVS